MQAGAVTKDLDFSELIRGRGLESLGEARRREAGRGGKAKVQPFLSSTITRSWAGS